MGSHLRGTRYHRSRWRLKAQDSGADENRVPFESGQSQYLRPQPPAPQRGRKGASVRSLLLYGPPILFVFTAGQLLAIDQLPFEQRPKSVPIGMLAILQVLADVSNTVAIQTYSGPRSDGFSPLRFASRINRSFR